MLSRTLKGEEVCCYFKDVIATSLFVTSGILFCSSKYAEALPCISTVQKVLYREYELISEGKLRFNALSMHLNLYQLVKMLHGWYLGWTSMLKWTGLLVLFSHTKDGLPHTDSFWRYHLLGMLCFL